MKKYIVCTLLFFVMLDCHAQQKKGRIEVYETSAAGYKIKRVSYSNVNKKENVIKLFPDKTLQTVIGFGGAFTESSAYLLNKLSKSNREKILKAYFSKEGANYSLTRTHMASCDFSFGHYTYAPVAGDETLKYFSVQEDMNDLIPMIKQAMSYSKDGFKIVASPWTAAPWMKDNNSWIGGKLSPKYYNTWALYFSKYFQAYRKQGINIWGVTVENEPNGNGGNWESMLYSPKEMTDFVADYLGPKLKQDGFGNVKLLGYDQNRGDMLNWANDMYKDERSSKYFAGIAVHWYESTYDCFADALQSLHRKAPSKLIVQTEACCDAEVPHWKDDAWYWSKEATDWGWDWASEKERHLHPKYVPVFRYARDIIGCLNNYVNGWIDWNMVLDRQGGPNWFKNWCLAPVIVDPDKDEVYFTPMYEAMAHFSKFIRPNAKVIKVNNPDSSLLVTAAKNVDHSICVVVLNEGTDKKQFTLSLPKRSIEITIDGKALQTVVMR